MAEYGAESLLILVVDDNPDDLFLIRRDLLALGHRVVGVSTAREALDHLGRGRPDVLMTDVGLPGMDGHELARRLRARLGEGCVLAALSGYGQESDRARARAAGFAHYLVKPASLAELQALVASLGEPRT